LVLLFFKCMTGGSYILHSFYITPALNPMEDGMMKNYISSKRFLTERDMKELEYENLINALDSTGWVIYGTQGAAELLGMNPSTLRSRLKTLGIRRPQ